MHIYIYVYNIYILVFSLIYVLYILYIHNSRRSGKGTQLGPASYKKRSHEMHSKGSANMTTRSTKRHVCQRSRFFLATKRVRAAMVVGSSPFGMSEETTSVPPVFFTPPPQKKCQKIILASPGLSGPLLSPKMTVPGSKKYARCGYINVTR